MILSDGDLTNKHVTTSTTIATTNDDERSTVINNTTDGSNLEQGQELIYCKQQTDTVAEPSSSSQGQSSIASSIEPIISQEQSPTDSKEVTDNPKNRAINSSVLLNTNDKKEQDNVGLRLRRSTDTKKRLTILSRDSNKSLSCSTSGMVNMINYDQDNDDHNADDTETEDDDVEHESFDSSSSQRLISSKTSSKTRLHGRDSRSNSSSAKKGVMSGTKRNNTTIGGYQETLHAYKQPRSLNKKNSKHPLKCLVANSSTSLLEDVPLSGDSSCLDDSTSSVGILSGLCSPTQIEESSLQTATQIFIPFIIAGCGTVGAGMVLDNVQHWDVFKRIDEIYILLPALLGLKGNLEMTLASRLSTHANLGDMQSKERRLMIASGNIALTQCQATIVSLLACILAFTINFIYTGSIEYNNIILITAAALLTAAIASLLLGLLMIVVVFVAQAYNINPDNIATPIAASLGDLITLSLYAFLTDSFYRVSQNSTQLNWFSISTICIFILLIPVWAFITRSNKFTRDVLYNGWTPILAAMIISSISGVILNVAVSKFTGIAVFHPVICGVGGNLVAVQASRLSTDLHRSSPLGQLPVGEYIHYNPFTVIFGDNSNAKTSRLLMAIAIPGHLFFAFIIATFESGHMRITFTFLLIYTLAAELQIVILLYLAYILTRSMWCKSIDPDNSSIPYLTAVGDFFGTTFLSCAFMLMHVINAKT